LVGGSPGGTNVSFTVVAGALSISAAPVGSSTWRSGRVSQGWTLLVTLPRTEVQDARGPSGGWTSTVTLDVLDRSGGSVPSADLRYGSAAASPRGGLDSTRQSGGEAWVSQVWIKTDWVARARLVRLTHSVA
jgi:hypothetical protein